MSDKTKKKGKESNTDKIDIIKYKKSKVTMLKYLEMAFIMKDMKLSVFEKKIPASTLKYHVDEEGKYLVDKLNLYKHNLSTNLISL